MKNWCLDNLRLVLITFVIMGLIYVIFEPSVWVAIPATLYLTLGIECFIMLRTKTLNALGPEARQELDEYPKEKVVMYAAITGLAVVWPVSVFWGLHLKAQKGEGS